MLTITTKLDASSAGLPKTVRIKQYASDFRLIFQLIATDGSLTMESGTTVFLRGTKCDGNGWQLGGTRSGTTVTFAGTHEQMRQMTAIAGRQKFEVVLRHSGKELPFASFILDVQRAAMDAGTVNPSQIDELSGQIVETTTVEYGGDNITVEDGTLIIS